MGDMTTDFRLGLVKGFVTMTCLLVFTVHKEGRSVYSLCMHCLQS